MNSNLFDSLENSKKIDRIRTLEVCIPIVKTYQHLAFPMSIVGCRERNKGWFYTNFINMYSLFNDGRLLLNYDVQYFEDEVYYLNMERLSINSFDLFEQPLIAQIKKFIDNEKYVCLNVDEYYIECAKYYDKEHYNHEIMIYGYDDTDKVVYCACYGADRHYKLRKVKYDSLDRAFSSEELNRFLPIVIYSYHEENEWTRPHYAIDPQFIKYQLIRYIEGTNYLFDRRHVNPLKCSNLNRYGIDIYDDVINYIMSVEKNHKIIDLRQFYFLYENKIVMQKRFQYMFEEAILSTDEFANRYYEIVKMCRKMLNYTLKYNIYIEKNKSMLTIKDEIVRTIEEIKEVERSVLCDCIKCL